MLLPNSGTREIWIGGAWPQTGFVERRHLLRNSPGDKTSPETRHYHNKL